MPTRQITNMNPARQLLSTCLTAPMSKFSSLRVCDALHMRSFNPFDPKLFTRYNFRTRQRPPLLEEATNSLTTVPSTKQAFVTFLIAHQSLPQRLRFLSALRFHHRRRASALDHNLLLTWFALPFMSTHVLAFVPLQATQVLSTKPTAAGQGVGTRSPFPSHLVRDLHRATRTRRNSLNTGRTRGALSHVANAFTAMIAAR